jgi:hypothetical protein
MAKGQKEVMQVECELVWFLVSAKEQINAKIYQRAFETACGSLGPEEV